MATLGNRLRTAQIDVDSVAVVLSEQGSVQQHLRIVSAKLWEWEGIVSCNKCDRTVVDEM